MVLSFQDNKSFNTQPPEGGWMQYHDLKEKKRVSTHSRPKAAGFIFRRVLFFGAVSTHSRPKAAGN